MKLTAFLLILVYVVGVLCALPAGAIIIRHDREDARYIALGAKFPSYCRINVPDGGGALIAPEWVLTAAHVAEQIRVLPHKVQCGKVARAVERVVINPEYGAAGRNDIALLKLSSPVLEIEPVPIYAGRDEARQMTTLIGHYITGNGKTGPDKTLKKELRGATNRIEKTNDFWLYFTFDAPDSPSVTDLEGMSGPGDSGAPAYITSGGKLFVAGVGSRSRDANRDGIEPGYGDEDLYTRVSSYHKWIAATAQGGGK
jgi:hypothetical protein